MKKPSLQAALDHVTGGLEKGVWSEGERLPNLDDLARAAGVAKRTMWKAIGVLRNSGAVSVKRGSRIRAGSFEDNASLSARPDASHSWESKRVQFEQDLLRGVFIPGRPLPSIGELRLRYGASYRTMRKLLSSLTTDKIITAANKKFFLPRAMNRQYRDSVCLLWEGLTYGFKARPLRDARVIESFQKECSLSDSALVFLGFDLNDPSVARTIRKRLKRHESIIGFIIRPMSLWDEAGREKYVELVMELALEQKPIAILDESGHFPLPMPLASNRLIKVFAIGAFSAGQSVGRMLLSMGHKRAAFFSQAKGELWSTRRFQGLSFEFAKAGYGDAVTQYAMEYPMDFVDTLLTSRRLVPEKIGRLLPGLRDARIDPDTLRKKFSFLDPIVKSNKELIHRFQLNMLTLAHIPEKNMYHSALEELVDRSIVYMRRDLYQLFMGYFFEIAATDPGCSAWVGANDDVAIFAQSYLLDHKIKVPEDVSLVGFDGDPLGFEYGITSFDFDFSNIARQMLQFFAHPSVVTRYTKGNHIEMPGFIIQRHSTGKSTTSDRVRQAAMRSAPAVLK